jgi:hypothetical protein
MHRFTEFIGLSIWVAKVIALSMLRFNVSLKLSLLDIVAQ